MSPTTYTTRVSPTTSYVWRPIIQSFDWITWNESTDTWNSVNETWDTYYSWMISWTQYTTRPII
jgi:hypothetical protein